MADVGGMAPFIVLVASFVVLWLLGFLGVGALAGWVTCLRVALALMFLLTASAHSGRRRPDLVRMVPPGFSNPDLLVTLTGVAEVLGAVGLLVLSVAPWAASGLAVLLLAVFPANVYAAKHGLTIAGTPATPLVTRTILQLIFLGTVLLAGFGPR